MEFDDKLRKLVELACQKDSEAFADLFTQYQIGLFRYLAGMAGKEDAEDLLQEAFWIAWNKLPAIENALSFKAWLFRIAHNLAIDYLRREKRICWRTLEDIPLENACLDAQDPTDRLYQHDLIQQTLGRLSQQVSEKVYACFLLVVVVGCTVEETAEAFDLGKPTVHIYVSQARSHFRKIYEHLEKEEEERGPDDGR